MLATLPLVNAHIRSDGNEYYAYLRSIAVDHDLHFDDEYAHGEDTFQELLSGELGQLPTGYRRNLASVGPAMMWAPFYAIGDITARVLSSHGHPVATDGYSWPYLWSCAIGTALYAFLGLWLAYRLALRYTSPGAAFLATVAIWLASSLPVYIYFLPFHAHGVATFAVAWFLWNWIAVRDGGGPWRWLIWGVSAGLATTTHYLNGLVLLVAGVELLLQLARSRAIHVATLRKAIVFGIGLAAMLLPGLVVRWIIEGSPFGTGYGGDLFYWHDPRLWVVAFAAEHGAFLWTPVLLFAAVGILWLCWRTPLVGIVLALFTGTFYYVVAAYRGWHGHSSYGNRFLTALTPVFVLGLAALIHGLIGAGSRRRWAAAWSVVVLLVLWNVGFMFQWGTGMIPNRGPVDMAIMARNQVTVVPVQAIKFIHRYFVSRSAAVADVERANAATRGQYQIKR